MYRYESIRCAYFFARMNISSRLKDLYANLARIDTCADSDALSTKMSASVAKNRYLMNSENLKNISESSVFATCIL